MQESAGEKGWDCLEMLWPRMPNNTMSDSLDSLLLQ